MAVVIESSYGKTIGLPGYSSHKFALSIKTEVADLNQISAEAERIYTLLQEAVDGQIEKTGYTPQPVNGTSALSPTNGSGNGDHWNCSEKQRALILKIVEENNLDKKEVDELARLRFGTGVKELNKLSASGLIDELLEKYGGQGDNPRRRNGGYGRRNAYAGRRR